MPGAEAERAEEEDAPEGGAYVSLRAAADHGGESRGEGEGSVR